MKYHNEPKFLNRQVCANSVDPDQTAPQDLHDFSDFYGKDIPINASASILTRWWWTLVDISLTLLVCVPGLACTSVTRVTNILY